MDFERKLDFNKYDKYGQVISPGDICVRITKDGQYSRNLEFCLYKGVTRGSKATGKFGRFITPKGESSIKHSNVVFAFDPMGKRRSQTDEVNEMVRKFYEGVKHEKSI